MTRSLAGALGTACLAALTLASITTATPLLAEEREEKKPPAGYPFAFKGVGDEAGIFPHVAGKGKLTRKGGKANQMLTVKP